MYTYICTYTRHVVLVLPGHFSYAHIWYMPEADPSRRMYVWPAFGYSEVIMKDYLSRSRFLIINCLCEVTSFIYSLPCTF